MCHSGQNVQTYKNCFKLFQDRISRLSDCDLRGLVVDIASQHPEFVFDVLDRDNRQDGGHHPPPDGPTPAWCTCTYCREMPTEAERRCCGRTRPNCYSRLPVCNQQLTNQIHFD